MFLPQLLVKSLLYQLHIGFSCSNSEGIQTTVRKIFLKESEKLLKAVFHAFL
jgi:hypothetical protein